MCIIKWIRKNLTSLKAVLGFWIINFWHKKWKHEKIIYLFLTPTHDNIGDAAIALAEYEFVHDYFPDYKILEITDQILTIGKFFTKLLCYPIKKSPFFIHGGGFLGSIWYDFSERPFRRILYASTFMKKILVFPQTIYYEEDKNGKIELEKSISLYNQYTNLIICARETATYDKFRFAYRNLYLIPDMVLYHKKEKNTTKTGHRHGVLLCLRDDKESTLENSSKMQIECELKRYIDDEIVKADMRWGQAISKMNRKKVVENQKRKFENARLVVTDRLHGMIFAAVTETPCVVLISKSHKILGCYQWIKHLPYIKIVKEMSHFHQACMEVINIPEEKRIYDVSNLKPYYDKLYQLVKKTLIGDD